MDYGKYKYEQEQKAKQARKHQSQIQVKEIKFRPKIGVHDYNTKKGHVERFLNQRAKVKVTVMSGAGSKPIRNEDATCSSASPKTSRRSGRSSPSLSRTDATW